MKILSFTCFLGIIIGLLGCGGGKPSSNIDSLQTTSFDCSQVKKWADTCVYVTSDKIHTFIGEEQLCCADQVQELRLTTFARQSAEITDLSQLKYFKNLRSLYLDRYDTIHKNILNLKQLEKLSIAYRDSVQIQVPKGIHLLPKLKYLRLETYTFPKALFKISHLKKLYINLQYLHNDPKVQSWLEQLKGLEEIEIEHAEKFPLFALQHPNLRKLKVALIGEKQITIPDNIGQLSQLEELVLGGMAHQIPPSIGKLSKLKVLNLPASKTLPSSIGNLQKLKDLTLYSYRILPRTMANLTQLEVFSFTGFEKQPVQNFGYVLQRLKNLRELDIKGDASIQELQVRIAFTTLDSLQRLNLSGPISKVPSEVFKVRNLKKLYISDITQPQNVFKEINQPSPINSLIIIKGRMIEIPDNIRYLTKLQYLLLASCNIQKVSTEIGSLTNLETLDLTGNPGIKSLPESIKKLKKLTHISPNFK